MNGERSFLRVAAVSRIIGVALGMGLAGLSLTTSDAAAEPGVTVNLRAAAAWIQLDGSLLGFPEVEWAQGGADLNGDGDAQDIVLHLWDASTGGTRNLGLAIDGFRLQGRWVALEVREDAQSSSDLNGDGDAGDFILHVFDNATGTIANIGLDVAAFFVEQQGDTLAFPVIEAFQGRTDLNGDGDLFDDVLHLFDAATGITTNLGVPTWRHPDQIQFRTNALAVGVPEITNADFNSDGDRDDLVLHLVDPDTGAATNLGLATGAFQLGPQWLAFIVAEGFQARTDLNGMEIHSIRFSTCWIARRTP